MTTFPIDENLNKRKTLTRADWRHEEIRRLIIQKGLNIEWTQSAQCPCHQKSTQYGLDLRDVVDIDATPGANNQSCPVCNGTGLIHHSSQDIKAIVTTAKGDTEIGEFGQYRRDEAKFTTQSEHLLSYGDRLKLKDSVLVMRETLTKAASNTVTTKLPIIQRTLSLETGALTIGVIYCHLADANGLAIANGIRIQGTHFTVDNQGRIVWNGDANTPAVGTKYSISYYANPTYIIIDHPHTVRDTINLFKTNNIETPTALPVQAYARLIVE
jgi:hypothetical protein